jgi:hypothetical protein
LHCGFIFWCFLWFLYSIVYFFEFRICHTTHINILIFWI